MSIKPTPIKVTDSEGVETVYPSLGKAAKALGVSGPTLFKHLRNNDRKLNTKTARDLGKYKIE